MCQPGAGRWEQHPCLTRWLSLCGTLVAPHGSILVSPLTPASPCDAPAIPAGTGHPERHWGPDEGCMRRVTFSYGRPP